MEQHEDIMGNGLTDEQQFGQGEIVNSFAPQSLILILEPTFINIKFIIVYQVLGTRGPWRRSDEVEDIKEDKTVVN